MSSEGMAASFLEMASKWADIGIKQFKFTKKILGMNFVVLRPKDGSKWKNVFGGSYTSDPTKETDYDQFTTCLVVNQNEMKDVWSRNRDTLEAYSDENDLEVGDEVQYTRGGLTFRFKVIQKQGYSEIASGPYVYILSSIIETLET